MAKDMQDTVKEVLSRVVQDTGKSLSDHNPTRSGGPLSGARGVAAGAGAAALAPVAIKGISKLVRSVSADGLGEVAGAPGRAVSGLTSKVGDTISSGVGDKISQKVDDAGGPSGVFSSAVKSALPFGGDDDDNKGDDQHKGNVPGVGKGRRMPVQQSVDIAEDVETVYNQWTQFELWPNFMHRVTRVTQEDDCKLSFATKIWGKTKEFQAEIVTQRPNDRIKWRVTEGLTHNGLVTFHEIGPHLTRVMLSLDVEPGGMLEKAARGLRHVKRAARADLHRFKAFIEMQDAETGAWRGVIEDGDVVEDHDSSYDKQREYSEFEDIYSEPGEDGDSAAKKRASQSGSGSRGRASGGRASGGRSSSGRSSSGRSSSGRSKSSSRSSSGRSAGSSRGSGSRSRSSSSSHAEGRSRSRGRS
ncbi:MAG TPA: SRPBCC family protein [Solirubrobacteraceae bacterium]|nr:SRPBCC family protein [Solirubrobacteraceae bacterium]